jgi:hypothetical protein
VRLLSRFYSEGNSPATDITCGLLLIFLNEFRPEPPPIPLLEPAFFLIQSNLAMVRWLSSMNVLLDPYHRRKPVPAGMIRNF